MFFGREKELAKLEAELGKPSAFVMVYGKRRTGKTSLIMRALKKSPDRTIYFACRKKSLESNTRRFISAVRAAGCDIGVGGAARFDEVFERLNRMDETFNVVIDEYPYLKAEEKPEHIDCDFQRIADMRLKNIRLFVCGSHTGMMKGLLDYGNPLFGRFSLVMEVKEWDYRETAAHCYPSLSPYDKVAFYSVFGGTPYIATRVDPSKSLRENIVNLYLKDNAPALGYARYLLMTEDPSPAVDKILDALGDGRKRYAELKSAAEIGSDSVFCSRLDSLLRLNIIKKDFSVNRPDDRKKTYYEIADNVLRFYHTFLADDIYQLERMTPDEFYDTFIEPTLTEYVSRRFEDICRSYFKLQAKEGKLGAVADIGRYWYDDPEDRPDGEFDVVLKISIYGTYVYDVYEAKYRSGPMLRRNIDRETEQIRGIKGLRARKIGFISVNGFDDGCEGELITGDDLYR